ncbi:sensor histidine kinase, partial [Actinocorallia lasiicapitis]
MASLHTIRARIALILAVPTLLLIIVAFAGVVGQVGEARAAQATADNVKLVLAAQELVHSLQRERGLSVGVVGGAPDFRAPLVQQRTASDATRAALDTLLAGNPSATSERIRAAERGLDPLKDLRAAVDGGTSSKAAVYSFFSTAIGALDDAMFTGDVGQGDARLRQGIAALRALSTGKEWAGRERATLNGVFATGRFTRGEYQQFTELRAAKRMGFEEFQRLAEPGWASAFEAAGRTAHAGTMLTLEQRAVDSPNDKHLGIQPKTWWAAITAYLDDLHAVQLTVGQGIQDRAAAIAGSASRGLLLYLGLAVLLLVGATVVGFVTFRSIVRPLRRLTYEARQAAEERLPEVVARIQAADDPGELDPAALGLTRPTRAATGRRDEFTEVNAALDHLQETAVRLAVEQAMMRRNTAESLANLGRRNQNLLRRQLGFISTLEQEEADPNQLANLFELDHLATRMRRNAESLLVLVGEHSPRKWSGSIPIGDVLRSALAEVEDYRRVVLRRVDDGQVRGAVAAELSHLLAELIENALSFSPPDQEVEVSARTAAGEYHVAIVDGGIGMPPAEIELANAKLRGERSFLVQPTRDLGHFVVGRLSERLGVKVWLHESPLNGVTARVVLPASVLEGPSAPRHAAPSRPTLETAPLPV